MDPDISKWPLLYQILAGIFASLTGILVYLRGSRAKPPEGSDALQARDREIARLRDERQNEQNRSVGVELSAIREDFRMAIGALKESIDERFHEGDDMFRRINIDINEIKTAVAIIKDRDSRRR